MITAFNADVLIYAADSSNPVGRSVSRLFPADSSLAGVGSVMLLTEVLAKPMRANPYGDESLRLAQLLARLELFPCDEQTAKLALALAVSYGLTSVDAIHLATAVIAGADRFLTNNRQDFSPRITEIGIVYPDEL